MSKQQPTFVGTTDIGQLEVTGALTAHEAQAQTLRDEAAAFARTIAPSTPIREALGLLVRARLLTEDESAALLLPGVWTWGDIPVILGRGEITDAGLGKKVRGVLGHEQT